MEDVVSDQIWVGAILPKNGFRPTIDSLGRGLERKDFTLQPCVEGIWFITRKKGCCEAFLETIPEAIAHNGVSGQFRAFVSATSVKEVKEAMRASGLFNLI